MARLHRHYPVFHRHCICSVVHDSYFLSIDLVPGEAAVQRSDTTLAPFPADGDD